ncbi:protein of unknown function [Modestobacter italicus]|uniref:Uncharacterized protein n=1 Tax=Modestobacter italicus (strain DSM 44449 / CECT 9708 / BC 501) TaxID=2732864 RepID=I4F3W2_MODI5|nr:hypothetical protein [Modestobacter marinus]CCH90325.1 protein of unknown function [Modestobacter marinus]
MTVLLPPPVALPEPPGQPAALGSVVDQLTSAASAADRTAQLLQPAGTPSGWQGADASAAAAEVGAARTVAADLHEAVTAAAARLADHHELWLTVLARLASLRDQQRHRFADAGARLAALVGVPLENGVAAAPAEAVALVRAVAEEDADRGAEHRALLALLAEDAAATAAVLSGAVRPFGGTGRPGDAAAVTVRLAGALPGWGAGALATLGAQAADQLTRPGTAGALASAVQRWQPYASRPAFAGALVGRLGADGVTWLLSVLAGLAGTGEEGPLAGLLAGALGGPPRPDGPVAEVLDAVQLSADDPDGAADDRAVAMGLVLAAPGAGSALAAAWGRQLLAREVARGAPAGAVGTRGGLLPDPVDAALTVLAGSADSEASALLLDEPATWTTLLSRSWPAGTGSLAAVIELAAAGPGAGRAARAALQALGEGLGPGSTGRVLDGAGALAAVRGSVTDLVAGQPGVLVPVLDAAGTGVALGPQDDAALRGLGHLATDAGSAEEVTATVTGALRSGAVGASAGEVAGAHVALLEYAERLRYALAWSAAQSRAVDAQMLWELGVKQPLSLVTGRTGDLLDAAEAPVADLLDVDGDVEIGPDTGRVRSADDAARFAGAVLGLGPVPGAPLSADAAARAGFARTTEQLGRLAAPEESLLDRLGDVPMPDLSSRSRRGG